MKNWSLIEEVKLLCMYANQRSRRTMGGIEVTFFVWLKGRLVK